MAGANYSFMQRIENTANDWVSHPELWRPVSWSPWYGPGGVTWQAELEGCTWAVRENPVPDQSTYTLLINGQELMDFDDWPWIWRRAIPLPTSQEPSLEVLAAAHLNTWGTGLEIDP